MKLPSKITSYNESILYKMNMLIAIIVKEDISITSLYNKVKADFSEINEFIDALDCLYVLKKIELNEQGVLHYAA